MKAPSAIEIALLMFLVINILFMLLQWRLSEIARRIGVVSRIDAKLDLLLKQAGIEYDPYKNLPLDVIDAVRRGAKIEAIKRYREATGTALKEAKQRSPTKSGDGNLAPLLFGYMMYVGGGASHTSCGLCLRRARGPRSILLRLRSSRPSSESASK
jgi:hypothetical protein